MLLKDLLRSMFCLSYLSIYRRSDCETILCEGELKELYYSCSDLLDLPVFYFRASATDFVEIILDM